MTSARILAAAALWLAHPVAADEPRFDRVPAPDARLIDSRGVERRFVQDIAGDRVVVLSFMFTTCETLCPVTNAILAALQARLDVETLANVVIVSVSIDPVRDDLSRLARSAAAFGAGDHGLFVGGAGADRVSSAFGMRPADIAFHDPVVFVGRADLELFTRSLALPEPEALLQMIDAARRLE